MEELSSPKTISLILGSGEWEAGRMENSIHITITLSGSLTKVPDPPRS